MPEGAASVPPAVARKAPVGSPTAHFENSRLAFGPRWRHRTSVHLATQLALFLDNRPGTLARVCEALAEAKINIQAFSTSDTVDHSVVRMVVDDPHKAVAVFEKRGAMVVESDILLVPGDNKPGSLANIAKKLAAAKVNIEYAYCATAPNAKTGLLVLRTNDSKKALKVLNT